MMLPLHYCSGAGVRNGNLYRHCARYPVVYRAAIGRSAARPYLHHGATAHVCHGADSPAFASPFGGRARRRRTGQSQQKAPSGRGCGQVAELG